MKLKSKIYLFIFAVIIALLLIPLIFKDKNKRLVSGPKLKDLTYSEVAYYNAQDSISLSGLLFLPQKVADFPLAIIIQGSGVSRRSNSWYLAIVKHLQNNGIGVFLPDKRGSGKSEGNWEGVSLSVLSTDTQSAINHFRQSPLKFSKLGIIGISQGGWIAPLLGTKEEQISFIVNVSGSMTSTDEQLLFEEYHNIAPYTYNFIAKGITSITTKKLKKKKTIAPLMGFDPIPYWQAVNVPVFIAYGDGDTNCPVKKSLKEIRENHLDHFLVEVYPNAGHGILDTIVNQVSPQFLEDLTDFILHKTQ